MPMQTTLFGLYNVCLRHENAKQKNNKKLPNLWQYDGTICNTENTMIKKATQTQTQKQNSIQPSLSIHAVLVLAGCALKWFYPHHFFFEYVYRQSSDKIYTKQTENDMMAVWFLEVKGNHWKFWLYNVCTAMATGESSASGIRTGPHLSLALNKGQDFYSCKGASFNRF